MSSAPDGRIYTDGIPDLAVAVAQLKEEVRLLRSAVDEIRDDVIWATRSILAAGYELAREPPPSPRDPLAPDLAPATAHAAADPATDVIDQSATEADESHYCCDDPQLVWHGDPDAPGVACGHCGYPVAEQGEIVIWRANDVRESSAAENQENSPDEPRQGQLFD